MSRNKSNIDLNKCSTSPYFSDDARASTSHGNQQSCLRILSSQHPTRRRLGFDFFNQSCITLAKSLLGQLLVHVIDGKRSSGFIVETECYLGLSDGASHSFQGKRTKRTEPMFMDAATSYVYSIYGMYYCFNITSQEEGACVLIRALEPYENLDSMNTLRQTRIKSGKSLKITQLASGPSKLCQALSITKANCNRVDMATSKNFWVEDGPPISDREIVISRRIGIDSSGPESANKPLRFYVLSNPHVSVRDKAAEKLLIDSSSSSVT